MSDKFSGGIKAGSTSVSIDVILRKTSDNTEQTGKLFSDIVSASYRRQGAARVAITPVTLAAITTAWADGGFKESDATNLPGEYRFDVSDAAFASGVDWVLIAVQIAGCYVCYERFALTTNTAQTGDSFARLGAPAGASIAADLAEIEGETDTLIAGVVLSAAESLIIFTGTASAGSSTTLTLTGASGTDNIYNELQLAIIGGTGAGQVGAIASYVGATKVATMDDAWVVTPDNTSVFVVRALFSPAAAGGSSVLAANGLDSIITESGLNARQALSIIAASAAGVLSGATTSVVAISGAGVGTPRISASVDGAGNRTAVTLSPPA